MAIIKSLRGFTPEVGAGCFLAETAVIIGDVKMGENCSIWYNAVLRGDVNSIILGDNVNIQDGSVVHTTYEKSVSRIGNNVSVGHLVNIHGAVIEDDCLIGMGSTLMDNCHIGTGSIIAAGSLVLARTVVEPYSMYAGVPAKKVKDVSPEQLESLIKHNAKQYLMYKTWFEESEQ